MQGHYQEKKKRKDKEENEESGPLEQLMLPPPLLLKPRPLLLHLLPFLTLGRSCNLEIEGLVRALRFPISLNSSNKWVGDPDTA